MVCKLKEHHRYHFLLLYRIGPVLVRDSNQFRYLYHRGSGWVVTTGFFALDNCLPVCGIEVGYSTVVLYCTLLIIVLMLGISAWSSIFCSSHHDNIENLPSRYPHTAAERATAAEKLLVISWFWFFKYFLYSKWLQNRQKYDYRGSVWHVVYSVQSVHCILYLIILTVILSVILSWSTQGTVSHWYGYRIGVQASFRYIQ